MSDQFLAEIRIVAFAFAPKYWAMCNGQLMPISQNTALFSLLGTTYGGNGTTTFALPNLQGAAPLQQGQGAGLSLRDLGETGGESTVTLLSSEMPAHVHDASAVAAGGGTVSPSGNAWAEGRTGRVPIPHYADHDGASAVAMGASALAASGGGQAHDNMPPYLTLNFCIALSGVYPTRP
jgi:microcystin-dependent protein